MPVIKRVGDRIIELRESDIRYTPWWIYLIEAFVFSVAFGMVAFGIIGDLILTVISGSLDIGFILLVTCIALILPSMLVTSGFIYPCYYHYIIAPRNAKQETYIKVESP